jgi:hypothetical protein
MPSYLINQFVVTSELELPCSRYDVPLRPENRAVVNVSLGSVPDSADSVGWAGRRLGGTFLRAYEYGTDLLICAGDSVKLLVASSGRVIQVEFRRDQRAADMARGLTMNLGMALCTLLNGQVALHGAAASLDGNLVGLLASSGSGKSTLLWSMIDRGAVFSNDDVIPLSVTEESVYAYPSVSLPAKLSLESIGQRGLKLSALQETIAGELEYWVPVSSADRLATPQPLRALFVLRPRLEVGPADARPDEIGIRRIGGGEALLALMEHTQGLWALGGHARGEHLLEQYLGIIRRVPIYVFHYRRELQILPKLAAAIGECCATHRVAAGDADSGSQRW